MPLIIKNNPPESSGNEKRFTLRMDADLFESISAIAKLHRRSAAKEIEEAIYWYVQNYLDDTQED